MPSRARRIARRAAFRVATSDGVERAALGVRPLRGLAFQHAQRYVAGLDEHAALAVAQSLGREGLSASIDLFGENVEEVGWAEAETERYLALAATVQAGTYVSLDCSHLGLDADPVECRDRVRRIATALPAGSRLQLGAEESRRTEAILGLARGLAGEGLPLMATVQANLRRSARDVEELAGAGIPVRLVKGAYVEAPELALAWGPATDRAFVALAERLAALGAEHALATHDPAILRRLAPAGSIEFLLGVRAADARRLAREGHRVRIYVPYGRRWFRYYARRVAESIGA